MANTGFSKELQTAITAAKKGAKKALSYFETDLTVEYKPDKSIVTKADRETEDVIKNVILGSFPEAKFVAEESGGEPNDNEYWIIDPIDGTRSYTRGVPSWCILIALCRRGEIILGVCYFPIYKTILFAEKGKGAFADGKRVHVSSISSLSQTYMGIGSIRHFKDKQRVLNFIKKAGSVRTMDSTYMNYLVSKGNMDANVDSYGHLWDIAPFMIIVSEAGGKVTNLTGQPYRFGDRGFIISNGILHDAIERIVNPKK